MPALFSCPQCQAVFSRSAHLRRHQKTHGAEKPYVCQFCPVASSRKDVIVRHTRNFHSDAASDAHQRTRAGSSAESSHSAHRNSESPSPASKRGRESSPAKQNQSQSQGQNQRRGFSQDRSQDQHQLPTENLDQEQPSVNSSNQDHRVVESQEESRVQGLNSNSEHCRLSDQARYQGAHPHQEQLFQSRIQLHEMEQGSLDYDLDFDLLEFETTDFVGTALDPLTDLPVQSPTDLLNHFAPIPSPSPQIAPNNLVKESHKRSLPNGLAVSQPRSSASPSYDDAAYTSVLANLEMYDPDHAKSTFHFPPRHIVYRFVNAFFRHMAPHMPIIHQPTFTVASTPSPLLIEIMACGALYLCERTTAIELHGAAQRFMLQAERKNVIDDMEPKFEVWTLQTYLLMSYFGAYVGDFAMHQRARSVFPQAIKLAQDAFQELAPSQTLIYKAWVDQETLVRCIAHAIELGAALASTVKEQCFTAPFFDTPFPLPCCNAIWQQEETEWQGCFQQPDSDQVLDCILAGQKPASPISDLGLVTLISLVLWRICSFEALAGSFRLDLSFNLVNKTDRAVYVLDALFKERVEKNPIGDTQPDPLMRIARALLNSVFYHLYASETLTEMKRLLDFPRKRKALVNSATTNELDYSSRLSIALTRAAEALQYDCQMGVYYVRRMAPHQFGPIISTACYEGGLLLSWYLKNKSTLFPNPELTTTLDETIDELSAELTTLRETSNDPQLDFPLMVAAELLSDSSVWQFPSAVSKKLKTLTRSPSNIPLQTALPV